LFQGKSSKKNSTGSKSGKSGNSKSGKSGTGGGKNVVVVGGNAIMHHFDYDSSSKSGKSGSRDPRGTNPNGMSNSSSKSGKSGSKPSMSDIENSSSSGKSGKSGSSSGKSGKSGSKDKQEQTKPDSTRLPPDNFANTDVSTANTDLPIESAIGDIDSPILSDDMVETPQNVPVLISPLENDDYIPPDAGASLTQPTYGECTAQGRDAIYTPDKDFCGMDHFTYTITDSNGDYSATAMVTINVICDDPIIEEQIEEVPTPDNEQPIEQPILNDDVAETGANTAVSIPVLDNDDYVPPDASGSFTQSSDGTVNFQGLNILYVPDTDFCGMDHFTYTITDSTGAYSATAMVTINVICDDPIIEEQVEEVPTPDNEQPILNDDAAETGANTAVSIPVLDNDDYFPPDALGSFTQSSNGTVKFQGLNILYDPDTDFCGMDQFTYTVSDPTGQFSDTAAVTVNVLCISVDPVPSSPTVSPSTEIEELVTTPAPIVTDRPIVNDDDVETKVNTAISISVLDNDDNIPPNASGSITQPTNGSWSHAQTSILYQPNVDFCGIDSFTYTVTNGEYSDTATVTVNVLCPDGPTSSPTMDVEDVTTSMPTANVRLVANDDFATTSQGTGVALSVLANDTVPADASGSFSKPSNGILSKGSSELVYTPNDGFCGVDTFTYTLSNKEFSDTATVTIDVVCDIPEEVTPTPSPSSLVTNATVDVGGISENPTRAPTAMIEEIPVTLRVEDDFAEGNMNEILDIPILDNDIVPSDAGGGFSNPGHGKLVEPTSNGLLYQPDTDFCGFDSFMYWITSGDLSEYGNVTVHIICDAIEDSPAVDCSVKAADDAAIVNPNSFIVLSPLDNDSCGSNENELSVASTTNPTEGVAEVMSDGTSIKYTPNANLCDDSSTDSITDVFLYTVQNQAGSSDFASVYVDICCSCGSTNTRPFALNDKASTTSNMPVTVTVLDNDGDADEGDILVITRVVIDGSDGICEISNDGQAIAYTPALDFIGNDMCVYEACDLQGDCTTAKLSLVVTLTIIEDIIEDSIEEQQTSLSCTTSMNAHVLVETLSNNLTLTTYGDHGTCSITAESIISFTPDSGYAGYDECTYSICDQDGVCSPGTLSITILPEAIAIEETTAMGSTASIPLNALYDLDYTQVIIEYIPVNGVFETFDGVTLLYTPSAGFEGSEVLDYSLCTVAEPILCDESTLSIMVLSEIATESNAAIENEVSTITVESDEDSDKEKVSNDVDQDASLSEAQSEAQGEESEDNSHSETMRNTSIVGAAAGLVLALAGTAAYVRKRGNSTNEGNFDGSGPWLKTVYSTDNSEASALTSELPDRIRQHVSSREIEFAGSTNLSVTAFLSGEAGSPEVRKSKRSIFVEKGSSSEIVPMSPANSLFSVSSSISRRDYAVDDVVDL